MTSSLRWLTFLPAESCFCVNMIPTEKHAMFCYRRLEEMKCPSSNRGSGGEIIFSPSSPSLSCPREALSPSVLLHIPLPHSPNYFSFLSLSPSVTFTSDFTSLRCFCPLLQMSICIGIFQQAGRNGIRAQRAWAVMSLSVRPAHDTACSHKWPRRCRMNNEVSLELSPHFP